MQPAEQRDKQQLSAAHTIDERSAQLTLAPRFGVCLQLCFAALHVTDTSRLRLTHHINSDLRKGVGILKAHVRIWVRFKDVRTGGWSKRCVTEPAKFMQLQEKSKALGVQSLNHVTQYASGQPTQRV